MYFAKYSSNGNDFVICHTFIKKNRSTLARQICDRFRGIGADGFIVIHPSKKYDFEWDFYNCDGGSAYMCGNGARAAAHYAYHNDLAPKKMRFLTKDGVIKAFVEDDGVSVVFTKAQILKSSIKEFGKEWFLVDTGVPHLVHFSSSLDIFDKKEAKKLRDKYNANVNVATLKDDVIKIRTYERGVEDETLACGTGMASCFLVALSLKNLKNRCKIKPKGGGVLHFKMKKGDIIFKGVTNKVFDCSF